MSRVSLPYDFGWSGEKFFTPSAMYGVEGRVGFCSYVVAGVLTVWCFPVNPMLDRDTLFKQYAEFVVSRGAGSGPYIPRGEYALTFTLDEALDLLVVKAVVFDKMKELNEHGFATADGQTDA